MSLKKLRQVRADRGFKIWDILVYGVVLAAIALMFISLFFTADRSGVTAIKITFIKNGESLTAFTYDYDNDGYEVILPENIEITAEDERELCLYFYSDDGRKEYNYIIINKTERSVWVEEANCRNKTCMGFGKLKNNNQAISCSPHGYMVIEPVAYQVSGSKIN